MFRQPAGSCSAKWVERLVTGMYAALADLRGCDRKFQKTDHRPGELLAPNGVGMTKDKISPRILQPDGWTAAQGLQATAWRPADYKIIRLRPKSAWDAGGPLLQ